MFSIGEFARHRRISVRMLRHYDAIGLLQPAHVLKLRQAEISVQMEAETARLRRVEARLMTIEDEGRAPVDGVVIKRLLPIRVAELTSTAPGYEPEAITPVIRPLYRDLHVRMASAGLDAAGPGIAYYQESAAGGGAVVVHAAMPVAAEPGDAHGVSVLDLPEVDRAATIIHHGDMDDVLPTGQALARWIDASGYQSVGYAREFMIEWSPDPEQWVTELQQPIGPARNEERENQQCR